MQSVLVAQFFYIKILLYNVMTSGNQLQDTYIKLISDLMQMGFFPGEIRVIYSKVTAIVNFY